MIVLLTEEPSMARLLEIIIPKLWPGSVQGWDWIVLPHEGKSDLERSIPKRMAGWNYRSPHFVILRDNDGADCYAIKKKLCDLAVGSNKPFHVRIVCQELESWLLGDLAAVKCAYPRTAVRNKAKFRDPDRLTNASQELGRLINVQGKIARAKNIGRHFDLGNNTSRSFNNFIETFVRVVEASEDLSGAYR